MNFFERDWDSLSNEELLREAGCTPAEYAMYEVLSTTLKPSRLRHSLGVMHLAMAMAESGGSALVEKARLAGLLHDCAKSEAGALEHGPKGAEKARRQFGVEDEEVLSAIARHTTGRAAMTPLEKILYVADYAEPFRRPLPGLPAIREAAFRDPDRAVALCAGATLEYLKQTGSSIDPATLAVADYYGKNERQL